MSHEFWVVIVSLLMIPPSILVWKGFFFVLANCLNQPEIKKNNDFIEAKLGEDYTRD